MRILPQWISPWNTAEQTCCGKKAAADQMLQILDKICRIALALFAFLVAPELLAISFGVGCVAAVGYAIYTQGGDQGTGALRPVCGQGYMEFLSGKTFSPWLVHVVTTLFIGAHVRHDPMFFVPFCGVLVGWWAGAEASNLATDLGRRAVSWYEQPAKPARPCPCNK